MSNFYFKIIPDSDKGKLATKSHFSQVFLLILPI